jgi:6-phosphogluconate dehydrogenase
VIVYGGNSFFTDSERRVKALQTDGILFVGMGASAGETGSLCEPSLIPGGSTVAWQRVAPMFQAISAKAEDGEACVAWMVRVGADHYVTG